MTNEKHTSCEAFVISPARFHMCKYDRFAEVGAELARAAGELVMRRFRTNFAVAHKGEVNLVTEVDLAAEELIVSHLLKEFPGHSILAEEKHSRNTCGPYTWVVDPLDGTTNYAHGNPVFAVSIGLEINGELACGVVYDPNLDEMFIARRHQGATCNDERIRVSGVDRLVAGLIATGFPYDIQTSKENNLEHYRQFALRAQGVRHGGSAALGLAYVAAGRLDGYWELDLHPWDCAAGYLLIREAGGVVTNFRGEFGSIHEPRCVASNGLIHEEMLTIIRETTAST